MNKFGKLIALAVSAAITLAITGCGSAATTTDSKTVSTDGKYKIVRIGSPTADATQLCENAGIAQKLGYIDEELEKVGYKAEYSGFGQGGTAVNEALSSNQIDLAFLGDIPPIIAKSNGLDVKCVASLNKSAEVGIVVGKNTNIKSVKDLKGKKIVAAFGTVTYVYLVNILNENGLSINDVNVINDIANGATLVASGNADAVISTGSGIYNFQNAGIGNILVSSRENSDLSAQFFLYGNNSYIKENKDAVKAIIKALIRSKDTAKSDPEKIYKALETKDNPASVFKQIYPIDVGFDIFDPYLTEKSFEKFNKTAKILKDSNVVTSDVDAKDVLTTEYLDEVYKELGLDIPNE